MLDAAAIATSQARRFRKPGFPQPQAARAVPVAIFDWPQFGYTLAHNPRVRGLTAGGNSMTSKASEPRLIIPALEPFYEKVMPLSWLIVRIAAGSILFVHGWLKVPRGPASFAAAYESLGFYPGVAWAWS